MKSFQELHSIAATGVVDAKTLAALNVPLDWRIQQVAINLQRWRWMPDELGERHFFVNIPHFTLIARESGKPVMDIRVVVGKPGNNTPIFSEEMETVVFSPYWNIPDTIAESETAPAIARDPNYLARQGIEILRVSGGTSQTLDASDVDWGNPDAVKGWCSGRSRAPATRSATSSSCSRTSTTCICTTRRPTRCLRSRGARSATAACASKSRRRSRSTC